jgi:hypothetical protein
MLGPDPLFTAYYTHLSRGGPLLELEYALEAETSKFFLLAPLHTYCSIIAAFTTNVHPNEKTSLNP